MDKKLVLAKGSLVLILTFNITETFHGTSQNIGDASRCVSTKMSLYKNTYRIESARLKEWDYSSPWWYYITINTKDHREWFGKIMKEKMILNEIGKTAEGFWKKIPNHFQNVELDYFIIMPNHLHGIIIINCTRRSYV